jgi:hypothetical protein
MVSPRRSSTTVKRSPLEDNYLLNDFAKRKTVKNVMPKTLSPQRGSHR